MYYWISQGLVLVLVIVSILHVHLGAERRSTEEATDSAPMGVIRALIIVCGVVLMGLNVATATRIDERLDTQLAEFQDQLGRLQSQVGRIDASVSSLDVLRSSEAAELEQLESVSKQQRQLVGRAGSWQWRRGCDRALIAALAYHLRGRQRSSAAPLGS